MASKKKASSKRGTLRSAPAGGGVLPQEYALRPIEELRKHPKNPKRGDVDAIEESIEENGFYGAVYVQRSSGLILAGNHKYEAAIREGIREIPCILVDCDDATAERILLSDNRTAELGKTDDSLVLRLLEDRRRAGSLRGTGYDEAFVERLRAKLAEKPKVPKAAQGTVKHTYTCPNCKHEWSSDSKS
jgi:ParB-like chromosome segregation protein Spo0J